MRYSTYRYEKAIVTHAHRLLRLAVWFLLAAALLWNGWLLAMWIVILGVRFKQPVWLLCLAAALLVGIALSLTTLAEDHKLVTYAVTGRVWNLLASSDLVVLAVLVRAICCPPLAGSKRKVLIP